MVNEILLSYINSMKGKINCFINKKPILIGYKIKTLLEILCYGIKLLCLQCHITYSC